MAHLILSLCLMPFMLVLMLLGMMLSLTVMMGLMLFGAYFGTVAWLETKLYGKETYNNLLKANVAPEMARMVLPQNLYTEWYWSGTLMAFARVCNLRCKPDTQLETQEVANLIDMETQLLFPTSWEALRDV